jgi:hypothetical protein
MTCPIPVRRATRRRPSVPATSSPACTLQRITVVIRLGDVVVTACRVAGARYVLCFDRGERRPRFVTMPRKTLATMLRYARRVGLPSRILGRV